MNISNMEIAGEKILARTILEHATDFEWSLQGMGMLRMHLNYHCRLHVWDSRFRVPGVSMIHDHLQWGLHSTVIAGYLTNLQYVERSDGKPYMYAVLKPGVGCHFKSEPKQTFLTALRPISYTECGYYQQEPNEIHETAAMDGTVTLMRKMPTNDESARVFWPAGEEWGSAEPRPATKLEVQNITGYALERWFK